MKRVVSSRTSKMSSDFERRQWETLMCRSSQDMEAINPQSRPKDGKQFCLIPGLVQFNLSAVLEFTLKEHRAFFLSILSLALK